MTQFVEVELDRIKKAEWNYKEEDPMMQKQLVHNIKKNGQLENIIVRRIGDNFEVINGNHRLDAFRELKLKKVMTCSVGEISDSHAARIAIETNETKFKADNIKLAELLESIQEEFSMDDLLQTMPYNQAEIENFSQMLQFNWESNSAPELDSSPNLIADVDVPMPSGEDSPRASSQASQPSAPDKRNITLVLSNEVADMFEQQIRRVKLLLFPEQLPEHVANEIAVQGILQVIAEANDDKFS